jgi:hypothetical protein
LLFSAQETFAQSKKKTDKESSKVETKGADIKNQSRIKSY